MATKGKMYELPLHWKLPPAGYDLEAPCRYRGRTIGHLLTGADGELRYQPGSLPTRHASEGEALASVMTERGRVMIHGTSAAVASHMAFVCRNQGSDHGRR